MTESRLESRSWKSYTSPEIRENWEMQDFTGLAPGTSLPAKREEIPKE